MSKNIFTTNYNIKLSFDKHSLWDITISILNATLDETDDDLLQVLPNLDRIMECLTFAEQIKIVEAVLPKKGSTLDAWNFAKIMTEIENNEFGYFRDDTDEDDDMSCVDFDAVFKVLKANKKLAKIIKDNEASSVSTEELRRRALDAKIEEAVLFLTKNNYKVSPISVSKSRKTRAPAEHNFN